VGELYRSTGSELEAEMAEAQQRLRRLNAIPNEGFRAALRGVASVARANREQHTDQITVRLRLRRTRGVVLVEQAVESYVSNTAKRGAPVKMAILWLRVRERGRLRPEDPWSAPKMLYQSAPWRQ